MKKHVARIKCQSHFEDIAPNALHTSYDEESREWPFFRHVDFHRKLNRLTVATVLRLVSMTKREATNGQLVQRITFTSL